jgi:hypothetical protein
MDMFFNVRATNIDWIVGGALFLLNQAVFWLCYKFNLRYRLLMPLLNGILLAASVFYFIFYHFTFVGVIVDVLLLGAIFFFIFLPLIVTKFKKILNKKLNSNDKENKSETKI